MTPSRLLDVRCVVLAVILFLSLALAPTATDNASARLHEARVGKVIFKDDFRNPKSGWDIGSDARESVGYRQGAYFIKIKRPRVSYGALNASIPAPRNVVIQVTARNVTGRSDTLFGVLCRAHGSHGHAFGYSFAIYDDGTYGIDRAEQSRTVTLIQGTSRKIPQRSASYEIVTRCVGPMLSLFVDGKQIASVKDEVYKAGLFGVRAGTDSSAHGPREVRFTNFVVRKP